MRRRILLVDDEVGITRSLAMYLEEASDCEVRVENVGSRALITARTFQPHIIFLDIVMPDADGGTLASEMEADPLLSRIPIVFLTALVSQHAARGGPANIGGRPFLAKPVDPEQVLACIDKHLGTSR